MITVLVPVVHNMIPVPVVHNMITVLVHVVVHTMVTVHLTRRLNERHSSTTLDKGHDI